MLKYHNINELEGKVAASLLDSYKMDYNNPVISSIVAGFHRAYGLRNEGISMSLEIVNNIKDDTENLSQRNILVWNLYILSREYIDDGIYDEAMGVIKRAEKNWIRDIILGDEIGVYHVSWLEQLWQRQAEIYLLLGDKNNFDKITDQILSSRFDFYNKAEEITSETVLRDRCTYNCLEMMAFEARKNDINNALSIIKQATMIKAGIKANEEVDNLFKFDNKNKMRLYKLFDLCLRNYFSIQDSPYDNVSYSYCKSCKYFDKNNKCIKFNIGTDPFKACSKYNN